MKETLTTFSVWLRLVEQRLSKRGVWDLSNVVLYLRGNLECRPLCHRWMG